MLPRQKKRCPLIVEHFGEVHHLSHPELQDQCTCDVRHFNGGGDLSTIFTKLGGIKPTLPTQTRNNVNGTPEGLAEEADEWIDAEAEAQARRDAVAEASRSVPEEKTLQGDISDQYASTGSTVTDEVNARAEAERRGKRLKDDREYQIKLKQQAQASIWAGISDQYDNPEPVETELVLEAQQNLERTAKKHYDESINEKAVTRWNKDHNGTEIEHPLELNVADRLDKTLKSVEDILFKYKKAAGQDNLVNEVITKQAKQFYESTLNSRVQYILASDKVLNGEFQSAITTFLEQNNGEFEIAPFMKHAATTQLIGKCAKKLKKITKRSHAFSFGVNDQGRSKLHIFCEQGIVNYLKHSDEITEIMLGSVDEEQWQEKTWRELVVNTDEATKAVQPGWQFHYHMKGAMRVVTASNSANLTADCDPEDYFTWYNAFEAGEGKNMFDSFRYELLPRIMELPDGPRRNAALQMFSTAFGSREAEKNYFRHIYPLSVFLKRSLFERTVQTQQFNEQAKFDAVRNKLVADEVKKAKKLQLRKEREQLKKKLKEAREESIKIQAKFDASMQEFKEWKILADKRARAERYLRTRERKRQERRDTAADAAADAERSWWIVRKAKTVWDATVGATHKYQKDGLQREMDAAEMGLYLQYLQYTLLAIGACTTGDMVFLSEKGWDGWMRRAKGVAVGVGTVGATAAILGPQQALEKYVTNFSYKAADYPGELMGVYIYAGVYGASWLGKKLKQLYDHCLLRPRSTSQLRNIPRRVSSDDEYHQSRGGYPELQYDDNSQSGYTPQPVSSSDDYHRSRGGYSESQDDDDSQSGEEDEEERGVIWNDRLEIVAGLNVYVHDFGTMVKSKWWFGISNDDIYMYQLKIPAIANTMKPPKKQTLPDYIANSYMTKGEVFPVIPTFQDMDDFRMYSNKYPLAIPRGAKPVGYIINIRGGAAIQFTSNI